MEDLPGTSKPSDPTPQEAAVQNLSARHNSSPKNIFQRRVTALFAASFAAFSFTTWLLTRTQIAGSESRDAATAEGVVRMQLNALAQGEPQIAYAQFSPQYRKEVPFATFQEIATTHGQMFRANTIAIEDIEKSSLRDEMRVRITSADGQHYVARYATVLIDGRWWIDAMRWRADETPPERVFTNSVGERVHLASGLALRFGLDLKFARSSVPSRARRFDTARRAA